MIQAVDELNEKLPALQSLRTTDAKTGGTRLSHLKALEAESIYILREAVAEAGALAGSRLEGDSGVHAFRFGENLRERSAEDGYAVLFAAAEMRAHVGDDPWDAVGFGALQLGEEGLL